MYRHSHVFWGVLFAVSTAPLAASHRSSLCCDDSSFASCSLYPNLRTVRQHYIFTSHAGAPLAVWDRRCMDVDGSI